jgi:hypothetical protein
MELTEETVAEMVANRRCYNSERCQEFRTCDGCLRDALGELAKRAPRVVAYSIAAYTVTKVPYGSHGADADAPGVLVGVYRTLEEAEAEIRSRTMQFVPVEASSSDDGQTILYEYALDGNYDMMMASVGFPQYVIARHELRGRQ